MNTKLMKKLSIKTLSIKPLSIKSLLAKQWGLLFCSVFFVTLCSAKEGQNTEDVYSSAVSKKQMANPHDNTISILNSVEIEALKLTLLQIAQERSPNFKHAQHFYFSRYRKTERLTYMYWAEMKLLWILSTSDTDEERQLGIRYPSRDQLIDLKNDVAATENEIENGSYLVTKHWAEQRLFETVVEGDVIIIDN